MSDDKKRRPLSVFDHENVQASVWANPADDGRTFYNVTFSKIYEQEGERKYARSFNLYDLHDVAHCALNAHRFITERLKADREKREAS